MEAPAGAGWGVKMVARWGGGVCRVGKALKERRRGMMDEKKVAAPAAETQEQQLDYTEKKSLANTHGSDSADGIPCIPLGEIYEFKTNDGCVPGPAAGTRPGRPKAGVHLRPTPG